MYWYCPETKTHQKLSRVRLVAFAGMYGFPKFRPTVTKILGLEEPVRGPSLSVPSVPNGAPLFSIAEKERQQLKVGTRQAVRDRFIM